MDQNQINNSNNNQQNNNTNQPVTNLNQPLNPEVPSSFTQNNMQGNSSGANTGPSSKSNAKLFVKVILSSVAIIALLVIAELIGGYFDNKNGTTKLPSTTNSSIQQPQLISDEEKKHTFNTITYATDAQKQKFRSAINNSNNYQELEKNFDESSKEFFSIINSSKQYPGKNYPSLCARKECIDKLLKDLGKANKVTLDEATSFKEAKKLTESIVSVITSMPIEMAHTITPVYYMVGNNLKDNKNDDSVVSVGDTLGAWGNSTVVLSQADGNQRNQQITTIHELMHVFVRLRLFTLEKDSGFKYDWNRLEKRPYSTKLDGTITSLKDGQKAKDGYVSDYAKTASGEDMAETFAYAYSQGWAKGKSIKDLADPIVKSKAVLIYQYLTQYLPKFNEQGIKLEEL